MTSTHTRVCLLCDRRVLHLSPDFIVDDAGHVFMEEMNTNGVSISICVSASACHCAISNQRTRAQTHMAGFLPGDETMFKSQADTMDMMRVIGMEGWPKQYRFVHVQVYETALAQLIAAGAKCRYRFVHVHVYETALPADSRWGKVPVCCTH